MKVGESMKKVKYLIIFIVMIVGMTIISYADSTIAYYSPYPKDITIYISCPDIGMKLILNDNTIEKLNMELDGKSVNAAYDKREQAVVYRSNIPLSPGQHAVDLEVHLEGWSNFLSQSWSFTVSDKAIRDFPQITEAQKTVLAFANNFRNAIGLPLVNMNKSLNAAANAHTNYMLINSKTTHDELVGNKAYTGGTPFVRAKSYGYNGIAVSENVSSGYTNLNNALQAFVAAPYHRIAWIDPYATDLGYSGERGYHTVVFGSTSKGNDTPLVVYPYDNQKDVQTTWENRETPNPLRNINDTSVGYPITISYFSSKNITSIGSPNITLKDGSGNKIEAYINYPGNDDQLTHSVIIIPSDPLNGATKYSISATFTIFFEDGTKIQKNLTSTFTTKGTKRYAYNDISSHWAAEVIDKLANEGIITAKSNNYFRPNNAVTRGEFCSFIARMLDLELKAVENYFSDVTLSTDNSIYIEAVKRYGIIKGYEDGTFKPDKTMSRQEMAAVIKRVYDKETGLSANVSQYNINFTDKDQIRDWAVSSVKLCNKLGIMKGRANGGFYPYDSTTRAESAVIINRLMEALDR